MEIVHGVARGFVAPALRLRSGQACRLSGGHPALLPGLACAALCFWLLCLPLSAKTKSSPSLDPDYISALAVANSFLHAWQTQDQETGLLLLTDAAKRATTEERLLAFFAPGSAVEQAYEIGHGRKLKAGRYVFPVALFVRGSGHKPSRPRWSQIIVIRTSKEDWAVDKLP